MQKRINIVDVLKPADDFIEIVENCVYKCICLFFYQNDFILINNIFVDIVPVTTALENKSNVIKWMIDTQYKKDQVIKMLLV